MKKDMLLTNNEKAIRVRISKELDNILNDTAKHEKRSRSELVREALILYLTKDINDKELLYSSINNLNRTVSYLDKKTEIFFNFWFFSLTSVFASMPDISMQSKQEQEVITQNAIKRKNNMFMAFKKTIKEQPSLLEAILVDFIEHSNKVS